MTSRVAVAVLLVLAAGSAYAELTPAGPELQVNTYTTGSQFGPDVAMDASGNFVVVWQSGFLFGPNQDFTAFSSGMNATARLQSLAGFREILVMDHARDAMGNDTEGLKDAAFEGPIESPVKNVAKPLRYYRVRFPESSKKK